MFLFTQNYIRLAEVILVVYIVFSLAKLSFFSLNNCIVFFGKNKMLNLLS